VRHRPDNFYELLTCGWRGHEIIGADAATIRPEDSLIVRDDGTVRWYRCLRCDAWIPLAPPADPTRKTVESRDEITVPLRGPALRDRYVLRLIACERATHVIILSALAILIFFFVGHHRSLEHDYDTIMNSFTGGSGGPNAVHGLLGKFRHIFLINTDDLYYVAAAALAYAALEAVEMVGLWFAKRWAEYLTFIATALFIPFEVYELSLKVSTLKVITFAVNLAIALYLLWAKRLFGIRGGEKALQEMREANGGWVAIEKDPVPLPA
jgi:uncharacterized membrane protein (DUF2068 family)